VSSSPLRSPHAKVLAGLIALGAALRFPTLGVQSYWFDEATTVVDVLHRSLADTLVAVANSESTPPLYYLLAWPWSKVFGTGEVGLRSLSAVLGTATIPVVYAAGATCVSRRAGLVAAALAAVSPWLIWYSQEARSYALLTLLAGLSFLQFVRSLQRPQARTLGWWAACSCLAVATHYFAMLLVLPEAMWLWLSIRRRAPRALAVSTLAIAATLAALAPLAAYQASHGLTDWLGVFSLRLRLEQTPRQFIAGPAGVPESLMWAPLAGLLAFAVFLLLARAREERRRALLALAVGAAVIALALALALLGQDYVLPRNLAAAWIPLAVFVAAGLGARRAGAAGLIGTLALSGLLAAVAVAGAVNPGLHRSNWREAAELIGTAKGDRAILSPFTGGPSLRFYLQGSRKLRGRTRLREIVVVGYSRPRGGLGPPRGFAFAEERAKGSWVVTRLRARERRPLTRESLTARRLGPPLVEILVQPREQQIAAETPSGAGR
jgi:mannosyltransferase